MIEVNRKETSKEFGRPIENNSIDISKRLDVARDVSNSINPGVDISKRIEPEYGKDLTTKQERDLEAKGLSSSVIKDCKYDDGIYRIKTINENLAGEKHPDTGVEYERKVIDLDGRKIEGVFPKFESNFTTILPPDKFQASDKIQFSYCIEQLKKEIEKNPRIKSKFSERQLEQIKDGKMPSGFTWHHNEEVGKMELVDAETHAKSGHTGGKSIWGGGSENR